MDRLPGESLKAWKKRRGEELRAIRREARRQESLYRQAQRVYDDEDRSPDSDPNDIERPEP